MKKTLTLKKKTILKPKKSTLTLNKSTSSTSRSKKSTLTLNKKSKLTLPRSSKPVKEPPKPAKKIAKKPKKVAKPKPPIEEPVRNKAARVDKLLAEQYPAWADCLPLSLGIIDQLIADYREDHTVKSIKLTMNLHVSKIKYLQNIIDKEHRVSLNGEEDQLIITKHKEHAKRKIIRLTEAENSPPTETETEIKTDD